MTDHTTPSPSPQDARGGHDSEAPPPLPPPCPRCGAPLPPGRTCAACVMASAYELGAEAAAPDAPGRPSAEALDAALPDYDVQVVIGRGGMGTVYRARHRKLDRLVAIKVLEPPAGVADAAAFTERFEREARVLASLDHPHIVRIHDFGRTGEPLELNYLVLEYVEGANLRDLLKAGKLSPREVLELVPQICEGLQAAHRMGVVHRDVKPENILVDAEGRVRIADFGLAKISVDEPTGLGLTRTSQTFGTYHYMAPEQLRGASGVDHRADLYSLGVVLYEMLTGELPVGRFPAPSEHEREAKPFDGVVLKALESQPERRHQAAEEVKGELPSWSKHSGGPAATPLVRSSSSTALDRSRARRSSSDFGAARTIALGVLILVTHAMPWFAGEMDLHGSHLFPDLPKDRVLLYPFETYLFGFLPLWLNWLVVAISGGLRAVQAAGAKLPARLPVVLDLVGLGVTVLAFLVAIGGGELSMMGGLFLALILHGINAFLSLSDSDAGARGKRADAQRRRLGAPDAMRRRRISLGSRRRRLQSRLRRRQRDKEGASTEAGAMAAGEGESPPPRPGAESAKA